MIGALRQLLRPREAPAPPWLPAVPAGRRVYAIGDIHGRLDLLVALAGAIEADDARRNSEGSAPFQTTIVLLGDLVDRGPDSAGVIAFAQAWQARRDVRILLGNHEELLLTALDNLEALKVLLRHGGRETLLSFGIEAGLYDAASFEEVQAIMRAALPAETLDYLRGFENCIRIGDYAFVHAGIRPGVPIEAQETSDLRWIREPFLSSLEDHGAMVVHGHTIFDEPSIAANRIGIDTGAYASGRLTALVLEGPLRWLIETRDPTGEAFDSDDGAAAETAAAASITTHLHPLA